MSSESYFSRTFSSPQKYSDNAVVFDGERTSWQKYLELPLGQRYEPDTLVSLEPISEKESIDAFVDIIVRLHADTYTYGENPDLFEQDINRLIYLKRIFFEREIILTTPQSVK